MWPAIMKCKVMVWCKPVSISYCVILVLATAVFSVQTGGGFAEDVMPKKKSSILATVFAPLACVTSLINVEIHLPWMAAFLGVKK